MNMINLDNIYNSPIIKDPWEHKVIDDVLSDDCYSDILEAAKILSKYSIYGETNALWLNEIAEKGVSEKTIDKIIRASDEVLQNIHKIISDFSKTNTSPQGYFAMPKFGISGGNFKYPIHSESSHKTMTIVIYLTPEEEGGTLLYTGPEEKDLYKETEWKPNRGLLIATNGLNDLTWHAWKNKTGKPRVTLNIFCEKLECLETSMLNSSKDDYKHYSDLLWLYDQIGKNHLVVNVE